MHIKNRRFCASAGILLLGLLAVSNSGDRSTAETQSMDDGPRDKPNTEVPTQRVADPDPHLIADRVLRRFSDSPFLTVTARITSPDRTIVVVSKMGKSNLRTQVFEGTTCIAALTANGKRVQEFVPEGAIGQNQSVKNVIVECQTSPDDVGIPRLSVPLVIDEDLGCLFGSFTASWLSPSDDSHPQWVADTLAAGTFIGRDQACGRDCLKFKYSQSLPGRTATHLFYVDESNMDVVRWDTTQSKDDPPESISRMREFIDLLHAPNDDGWVWRLSMKEIVASVPDLKPQAEKRD